MLARVGRDARVRHAARRLVLRRAQGGRMSVATERATISVLDLGPFLAGAPGAAAATATALRDALERVGFFFIVNHGIPWPLVREVFGEARRFHALPLDEKLALKMSTHTTEIGS